jgi:peptidoglycan/LPS O-acetylase OafA/YrhL
MSTMSDTGTDRVARPSAAQRVATVAAYRPHLDGLRAVAVYLVVLFHAGIQRVAGGFIGVDVDFVLSGFPVTRLLVRDVASRGSIGFGRFYARRFRRLLPAAFVALIGTALLVTAIVPAEALASIGAFKAAFLYSANWYFIGESTAYFGSEVATNPVLPFWSLAVEEQFYLVWPLLLGGLFWLAARVRRHQLLVVRLAVASAAIASLAWALHLRTDDALRAYYGTDARVYQLLAGASLALVPDLAPSLSRWRGPLRWVAPIAVVALVVVATSVGIDDPIVRGVVATFATAVALLALEGEGGGLATRVLASPPLVYLGRVSYGTYLWHWPVIIVATTVLDLSPRGTAVLACVVATGIASLSYQVLEQPVRASSILERHRLAVIATGLAVSVVSALVIIPAVIEPRVGASAAEAPPTVDGFTPVPAGLDTATIWMEGFGKPIDATGAEVSCVGREVDHCTVVHGSGEHILLMGDSNAQMMTGAFRAMAEEHDLTLSFVVAAGCPWQRGYYVLSTAIREQCRLAKEDAYTRVISQLDPDVIVVMNSGYKGDKGPSDPEGKAMDPAVEAATSASLDELTANGRSVVVIEPMPRHPDNEFNPLTCLGTAKVLEDCRYLAVTDPTWYELETRAIAERDDRVLSADFDRLVCPYLPICDPMIGGTVVKWDGQHLTKRFSVGLAEPIATYLREHGLISS